jgi:hypothetical protein
MVDEAVKMRGRFTQPIEQAALELALTNIEKRLRVFVAGPYIERGWSEEDRAMKEPSALLRLAIAEYVERVLRHEVVYGEHKGVKEIADEKLRSRSSPVLFELNLVKNTCSAVIIVPASPGSFSELGAWSIYDPICKKMLILADKNFENGGGYIGLGVFKIAVDQGATLRWINYNDIESAINVINQFIESREDAALSEAIRHG